MTGPSPYLAASLTALGLLAACSDSLETDAPAAAPANGEVPRPGIVTERPDPEVLPDNARVIALDDGTYMVPYQAEIPGFDVTYQMTPVPGGTFTMGSPPDEPGREDDEGPQFEVEVEPFWMGRYEITWAEYRTYMQLYEPFREAQDDRRRRRDDPPIPDDHVADAVTLPTPLYAPQLSAFEFGDDDRHPAVTMKPYAARQYTKFLSKLTGRFYRLPTEAEWEYAARAGTTTAWSFGDDPEPLAEHARYHDPDRPLDEGYLPVGSLKPNPWGLYDMHGNVAEIVFDQYIEDHYARFADAEGPPDASEVIAWPTEVSPIVVRGGGWEHDAEQTRSAARWQTDDLGWTMQDANLPRSPWWFTEFESQMTGFRIVRPLNVPDEDTQHRFWGSREQDLPEQLWKDLRERLGFWGAYGLIDQTLQERLEALREQKAREREEAERRYEEARQETFRLLREHRRRAAERRRAREAEDGRN